MIITPTHNVPHHNIIIDPQLATNHYQTTMWETMHGLMLTERGGRPQNNLFKFSSSHLISPIPSLSQNHAEVIQNGLQFLFQWDILSKSKLALVIILNALNRRCMIGLLGGACASFLFRDLVSSEGFEMDLSTHSTLDELLSIRMSQIVKSNYIYPFIYYSQLNLEMKLSDRLEWSNIRRNLIANRSFTGFISNF